MEGESADVEDNPRDSLQMESAKSLFNETTRFLGNEIQSKREISFCELAKHLTLEKLKSESLITYVFL